MVKWSALLRSFRGKRVLTSICNFDPGLNYTEASEF